MERNFPMSEKRSYAPILIGVLVLFGLYRTSSYSYLLFHSLAEIFSIVVACGIFMIAWNSRRFLDNTYLLFIGIAYLFVGGLDLIHTLAYKGMGVFEGYGTNLPTQLWIAARYVESLSLLIAPLFLRRRLNVNSVFLGYALATSLLLGSIFYWNLFPICFIEGVGLTPFKKISEYVISLVLFASIAILLRKRRQFDASVLRLLVASIILTIVSELAFTFYIHAYGLSNLIGHYLKIISFYFIYKAFIETGLAKPYALLFRNLKQSEEALRESEERFRQLSENVQDAFSLGTPGDGDRGEILYVNPAFEEIFGIKAEEIYETDNPWLEMLHEDDRDRVLASLEEFLKDRGEYDVEYRIVRDQGEVRWIWAKAFPIRNERGEMVRTAGIAQDITHRKQAEDELRKLSRAVEQSPATVVITDGEGTIEYVNPKFVQLTGYSPAEAIGQNPRILNSGKHPPEFYREMWETITGGEQWRGELYNKKKNGDFYWEFASISPIRNDEGAITHFVGVKEDITERKRAEDQIIRAKQEWERTFDAVPDLIMILDNEYRVVRANRATADRLGCTPKDLVGRLCYDAFHGAEKPVAFCPHARLIADGLAHSAEVHEDRLGGDFLVSVNPLHDPEGKLTGSVHVARDITERKRAEQALRTEKAFSESMLNAMVDTVFVFDPDTGKPLRWNKAFNEISGYTDEEITSLQAPDGWYDEADLKHAEAATQKVLQQGRATVEMSLITKQGRSIPTEYTASFVKNAEGKAEYILAIGRDITERKGAEVALQKAHQELERRVEERTAELKQEIQERERAQAALQESEKQLRYLSSQLMTAQENERKSVAQELHDSIGQTLAAIKFGAEKTLEELGNRASKKIRHPLEAVISMVQNGIQEVRRIQMDLRPSTLDDLGIIATISWFCREFQTIYAQIRMEKEIGIQEDEVPDPLKTIMYRVLQEALHNVAKHSQADRVRLSLRKTDSTLELAIEDNGLGFDLEDVLSGGSSKRGLGLASMRERTELSGGSFAVETSKGEGTTIRAVWKAMKNEH
jgi:PAS domain S-box-containing protein